MLRHLSVSWFKETAIRRGPQVPFILLNTPAILHPQYSQQPFLIAYVPSLNQSLWIKQFWQLGQ